jgi:hypothetical protein
VDRRGDHCVDPWCDLHGPGAQKQLPTVSADNHRSAQGWHELPLEPCTRSGSIQPAQVDAADPHVLGDPAGVELVDDCGRGEQQSDEAEQDR